VSSGSPVEGLVYDVFRPFGIGEEAVAPLVVELLRDETATVDFLMSFHHSLPPGNSSRTPLSSALTIAAGYFLGGFVPLRYVSPPLACRKWERADGGSPYFFVGREEVMKGLWWSVGVMAVCLFVFGVGRSVAVGEGGKGWKGRVRGGVEMVVVGGVAAGASWGIVKALGDGSG